MVPNGIPPNALWLRSMCSSVAQRRSEADVLFLNSVAFPLSHTLGAQTQLLHYARVATDWKIEPFCLCTGRQ
jgi:hypothetical protein